ncbi:MAG: NYN domain-containing protein [Endomicrobium sp.]|jgi:predicted RNA-binding protein with PIN domain|nr:NYN domain-containing protein [Endomicrobium sp.]
MHYIVDGYNVINCSDNFTASTLEGRRNKLIDFILHNRPHGSLRNIVTVVFDCKSKNPYESGGYNRSHVGSIEIIFSDGIMLADDIIAEMVDNAKNPYEITVVTNDKGIRRRTSPGGAKHESVESFLAKGLKQKNTNRSREVLPRDIKEGINEEFEQLWLKKRGIK